MYRRHENKKRGEIMKKLLLALALLSLLAIPVVGCTSAQLSTPTNQDVIITLERTACFGTCPVYSLTIQGEGTVMYEGKDFVEVKGEAETTISQDQIDELISEFEKVDYFSLEDSYTERTITDAPTVITSISISGKTKTIEHYHGDFSAPEKLRELEDRIDEIVDSDQWIK
jgi:hypothetical protein